MKWIVLLAMCVVFSGCTVNKQWSAYSGSRADGVVKLAYSYGAFDRVLMEEGQGTALAQQKCSVWGYTGAEAFGDAQSTCVNYNQYGCNAWRVTAEFQCTGKAKEQ